LASSHASFIVFINYVFYKFPTFYVVVCPV
jgi:hypothetical protein